MDARPTCAQCCPLAKVTIRITSIFLLQLSEQDATWVAWSWHWRTKRKTSCSDKLSERMKRQEVLAVEAGQGGKGQAVARRVVRGAGVVANARVRASRKQRRYKGTYKVRRRAGLPAA